MAAKDRRQARPDAPAVATEPAVTVPAALPLPVAPVETPRVQVAVAEIPVAVPAPVSPVFAPDEADLAPINIPDIEIETIPVYEIFDDGPVIDGASIIEDEIEEIFSAEEIFPAEAVAVVSDLVGKARPSHTKLEIEILGDARFRGGERKTLSLMICRGSERKVIGDAEIMVKVLGSGFRPVIFHARSDANGLARIHLQLPHFNAGRAALLVRARSNGDETELRKIVTPG
jgi:hypothetical protein